jgi:hypothetical protein
MSVRVGFAAALAILLSGGVLWSQRVHAQDFGRVNKFEALATGTLHVGSPPTTIIDDGKPHLIVLTIWDADAETKVYWKSPDVDTPRTTVIPGRGVQTFQTVGELRLEAIGEPNHHVEYGYMVLGLETEK